MAALPTAPAPPATSTTRSCKVPGPSRDGPSSVTVRQRCAVRNGIPRQAPRSKDASTGSRTTWLAGTIANSWAVPSARRKAASHIHTRWPTSAASTPMPTASTTPAPSWPGTCGGSITEAPPPAPAPRRDFQSVGFTPDRCTAILACPGPGSGTALSIRVRTSGSPVLEYTTARIRPTVIARRPDRLPRVSTLSESRPAPVGVLLRFDGVVHSSDLPVQSFARHLTDALPTDQVRAMIAGMRGFLEGKPELIPAGIDLAGAEDGYQAVETARPRGRALTDAVIDRRVPGVPGGPGGQRLGGRRVRRPRRAAGGPRRARVSRCVHRAGRPGGIRGAGFDRHHGRRARRTATLTAALAGVRRRVEERRPASGFSWSEPAGRANSCDASEAGYDTALVDRYRLGRGTPTLRSPDVAGLVEPVRRWCAEAGHRVSTVARMTNTAMNDTPGMTTGRPPTTQRRERPSHVIAHLSDTHLTSAGVRYNGVLDADAALDRAVAVLAAAVAGGPADRRRGGVRRPDRHRRSGRLRDGSPSRSGRSAGPRPDPHLRHRQPRRPHRVPRDSCWAQPQPSPILQVHDVNGLRDHRAGFHHSGRRARPVDRGPSGRTPRRTGHPGARRQHRRAAPRPAAAAVSAAVLLRPGGVIAGGLVGGRSAAPMCG